MADRITGSRYLDPGDRLSGRHDPSRPCVVLTRWGPGDEYAGGVVLVDDTDQEDGAGVC
jgi:hypothetical protein